MNLKEVKLENGLSIREMSQKQNNRTKNLIVFLLVAVIVGALAFAGCFIALEISRTNAYNKNLHNSIITPPQTEPDEPITDPTQPDDNNTNNNTQSGGGNISGETETNAIDAGGYDVLVQTVWGMENLAYDMVNGVNMAYNITDMISIRYWDVNGVHGDDDSENIALWQKNRAEDSYGRISTPTIKPNADTDDDEYDEYGKNNAIGLKSGIDAASSGRYQIDLAVGKKSSSSCSTERYGTFFLAFVQQNSDGSWTTLVSKKVFNESGATLTLDINGKKGGVKIYAVCTKTVMVNVSGIEVTHHKDVYNIAPDGRTLIKVSESSTTSTTFKVELFNCVNYLADYEHLYRFYINNIVFSFGENIRPGLGVEAFQNSNQKVIHYWQWTDTESYYLSASNVYNVLGSISPGYWHTTPKLMNCIQNGTIYAKHSGDRIAEVQRTGGALYNCFTVSHIDQFFNSGSTIDLHMSVLNDNALNLVFNQQLPFVVNINAADKSNFTFNQYVKGVTINKNLNWLSVNGSDKVWQPNGTSTLKNVTLIGVTGEVDLNGKVCGDMLDAGWEQLAWFQNCPKIYLNEPDTKFTCSIGLQGTSVCYLRVGEYQDVHTYDTSTLEIGNESRFPDGTISMNNIYAYDNSKIKLTKNMEVNIVKMNGLKDNGYFLEVNSSVTSNINVTINENLQSGSYYIARSKTNSYLQKVVLKNYVVKDGNGNITNISYEKSGDYYYLKLDVSSVYEIVSYNSIATDSDSNSNQKSIQWMKAKSSYYEKDTFILKSDITLPSGFTGISSGFKGTFDGNGFMLNYEEGAQPLFQNLANCTIKNLVIAGYLTTPVNSTYYCLGYESWGTVNIINVHNLATFGSQSSNLPQSGMIYKNFGTLQFINCAVQKQVPEYYGSKTTCAERANYVAYNYDYDSYNSGNGENPGKIYFYNCFAKDGRLFAEGKTNKTGSFVGYSYTAMYSTFNVSDSYKVVKHGLHDNSLYFENCVIAAEYLGTGSYRALNGLVGATNWGLYEHAYETYGNMSETVYNDTIYIHDTNTTDDLAEWVIAAGKEVTVTNYNGVLETHALKEWLGGYLCFREIADVNSLKEMLNGTPNYIYRSAKLTCNLTSDASKDVSGWTGFSEFAGYFDGGNFTIEFTNATQGFTRKNTGIIKNLIIKGTINGGSSDYIGAIAGENQGKIEYCSNYADVTGNNYVGGLIGYVGEEGASYETLYNNIRSAYNLKNYGNVTGNGYVGGVVGLSYLGVNYGGFVQYGWETIDDPLITGTPTITGYRYIGGIVGSLDGNATFYSNDYTCECIIKNNKHESKYIGGIIGYIGSNVKLYRGTDKTKNISYNVKLESGNKELNDNSYITLSLSSYSNTYVGGVVGYSYVDISADFRGTITQNSGSSDGAGGIVGFCEGSVKNSNVYFTGNIELGMDSGGIVASAKGTVENCTVNVLDGYYLLLPRGNNLSVKSDCGAIVGSGVIDKNYNSTSRSIKASAINCNFNGKLKMGGDYAQHSIFALGESTNCMFKGEITIDKNSSTGSFYQNYLNYGKMQNCVIDATINNKTWDVFVSENSGFKISYNTATKCFITGVESKIITTAGHTNCSTFVSLSDSLVYNGTWFGYVCDAISDGSTYWDIGEAGYPVISSRLTRNKDLKIVDTDQLNAINDMIITNKINYAFTETFTFINSLNLKDFAGLGDSSYAVKGTSEESPVIFRTASGVELILGENSLFNNVLYAQIDGFVFRNGTDDSGEIIDVKKSPIAKAVRCTIINCTNHASINSSTANIGGLIGYAAVCSISNCLNHGKVINTATISGNTGTGGIVGYAQYCELENCVNYGSVESGSSVPYVHGVGGIVGLSQYNITIKTSKNYGNIEAKTINLYRYLGGIIGVIKNGTVENSYSNSIIEGRYAGGIVGLISKVNSIDKVNVKNCISDGIITLTTSGNIGGIVSIANTSTTINITNCVSFVTIKSADASSKAAGIITLPYDGCGGTIRNSYFFGSVDNGYMICDTSNGYTLTILNCGYNINNIENSKNNGATLIYVQNTNPVWSSQAYIKILFKTETESMLSGTNEKLQLSWIGGFNTEQIEFFVQCLNS